MQPLKVVAEASAVAANSPCFTATASVITVLQRSRDALLPNTVDSRPLVGLIRLCIELGGNGDI